MFSKSSSRNSINAGEWGIHLWLMLALGVGLFYLAVAAWGYGVSGFPLDDAWIHQTYARNLGRHGQWAFVAGQPSAGSTAPLWSLLLSLGYLLRIPFRTWTYGLGIIFLGLTGWTTARLGARLFPKQRLVGLGAGLFCIFEWHLAWAAVSGMETILFVWLSVWLVERYLMVVAEPDARKLTYFGLGMLGSLLILTRPEGVGLVGLVGLDIARREWGQSGGPGRIGQRWLWLGLGGSVLLGPYLVFHLWLTGLPLPNTFYAKQAEYRVVLATFPLWWRLFGNFGPPVETVQGVFRVIFIGAQVLLLPGLATAGWLTVRQRRADLLMLWVWWVSYLLLYGLRLPVTYQHGRYQIPAIPWVILLGLWGTAWLWEKSQAQHLLLRAAGRALGVSLAILLPAFTVIGAMAYGRDVRFIESEMVAIAGWLDENIAPDALVAVHDIGAIGYFSQRPLIDLAGLVTPEVIPIIRDEAALLEFVTDRQAGYLVTFPTWYPTLTDNPALTRLHSTGSPRSDLTGGEHMTVYRIESDPNP